jgi:succinate dehydrogenase/fumarate reductase flavoprotein subunit
VVTAWIAAGAAAVQAVGAVAAIFYTGKLARDAATREAAADKAAEARAKAAERASQKRIAAAESYAANSPIRMVETAATPDGFSGYRDRLKSRLDKIRHHLL